MAERQRCKRFSNARERVVMLCHASLQNSAIAQHTCCMLLTAVTANTYLYQHMVTNDVPVRSRACPCTQRDSSSSL